MSNIEEVSFSADGQLLNQLSSQVSSHLFALGELLKNSYDAQATEISVILDLNKNILIVLDNGIGISKEEVSKLLHIGGSSKNYGEKFQFGVDNKLVTRITQGSKGLGLLSAFKFGNVVTWNSNTLENSFSLTVDKRRVVSSYLIGDSKFPLRETELKTRGTQVTIRLDSNDPEINFIFKTLSNLQNSKKLVQFFYQNDIKIFFNLIDVNGNEVEGFPLKTVERFKLNKQLPTNKILEISYDSLTNNIKFTDPKTRKSIVKVAPITIEKGTYSLFIHLNAYSFTAGGTKKIDKVFHNSREELAPLIYINKSLFNNETIFDPSITRKIKGDKVLSQLTGFVRIISSNPCLEFNAERTDLIQNAFNAKLREDIKNLNTYIQKEGRKISKEFISESKNQNSTSDNDEQQKLDVDSELELDEELDLSEETDLNNEKDLNEVKNENNGNSNFLEDKLISDDKTEANKDNDLIIPFIRLSMNRHKIQFSNSSDIINLNEYFLEAKNSKDEDVKFDDLSIKVNGSSVNSPLLESKTTDYKYEIIFSFDDKYRLNENDKPFRVTEHLTIILEYKPRKFNHTNKNIKLISPLGAKTTLGLTGIDRLIKQLNELFVDYDDFDVCIAASIRVIFDLTTYEFETHSSYQYSKTKLGLEVKVKEIIEHIKSDAHTFTDIAKNIGIRHSILKNIFADPGFFELKVSSSNLGSHTGILHISKQDIIEIAKSAGNFAQLVDAYCQVKGYI